jgi:hypothetical protein
MRLASKSAVSGYSRMNGNAGCGAKSVSAPLARRGVESRLLVLRVITSPLDRGPLRVGSARRGPIATGDLRTGGEALAAAFERGKVGPCLGALFLSIVDDACSCSFWRLLLSWSLLALGEPSCDSSCPAVICLPSRPRIVSLGLRDGSVVRRRAGRLRSMPPRATRLRVPRSRCMSRPCPRRATASWCIGWVGMAASERAGSFASRAAPVPK